ncbi:hypothetical protein [Homoserinibacter sp. GY 40078]|uniref:hypothetical protein n=1 Tax=Homoserinibacter sp. GY 40078 TaxID=2603275 RepID=UPI0011DA111C|nr:hypothetical protein [Homoserinibacter sp. GY 40078]TXK17409.1 hypothetical protein FVQ89_11280 [Homoserinibacter sp. GY 40078]
MVPTALGLGLSLMVLLQDPSGSSWYPKMREYALWAYEASVEVMPWLVPVFPATLVAILVWLAIPQRQVTVTGWRIFADEPILAESGRALSLAETQRVVATVSSVFTSLYVAWCLATLLGVLWPSVGLPRGAAALFALLPVVVLFGAIIARYSGETPEGLYVAAREHHERTSQRMQVVGSRWAPSGIGRALGIATALWVCVSAASVGVIFLRYAGALSPRDVAFLGVLGIFFAIWGLFPGLAAVFVFTIAFPPGIRWLAAVGIGIFWLVIPVAYLVSGVIAAIAGEDALIVFLTLPGFVLPGLVWVVPWWAGKYPLAGASLWWLRKSHAATQSYAASRKAILRDAVLGARPGRRYLSGLVRRLRHRL